MHMESTGVYWKPIYNILEDIVQITLANARHVKNLPGHKTLEAIFSCDGLPWRRPGAVIWRVRWSF
jgi:hypothetical protein